MDRRDAVTPDVWALVKPVFHAALDVPLSEREAFVGRAFDGEPAADEARAELRRLLAAHDQASTFIERSPVAGPSRQPLTGCEIGRYRVDRLIGAGGMGEVYLARDQELGRDVALKIAVAQDAAAQTRLRREAQHASRLNHPHICTVYEVGSVDGQAFIAMELVEGPTLADRIARGPMSAADVRCIATQLALALDAAHGQGLVHRDLKPANIKVRTDGIKVLDFGLAKTVAGAGDAGPANPVDTSPLTQAGAIFGTVAYMSPEQLRGSVVDKRADIWAFGCIVYEMLTGARAFGGGSTSEVIAAVMTSAPSWDAVPVEWQPLLRRCLEADPFARLRDIGDAMAFLDSGRSAALTRSRARRGLWPWAAAFAAAAVTALVWSPLGRSQPVAPELVRFDIVPPGNRVFRSFGFAPSHDGRYVAFVTEAESSERSLWVYSMHSGTSRKLADFGQVDNSSPFWSPDARFVGLFSGGKLQTIDVATGNVQTLYEAASGVVGLGSWSSNGTIVFAVVTPKGNDGVMKISAAGGAPTLLTRVLRDRGEIGHNNPAFLSDGRHFLYQRVTRSGVRDVYVGSIDVAPDRQSPEPAVRLSSGQIRYSGVRGRGHIMFMQQGKVTAQLFDEPGMTAIGPALPVQPQSASEIASREIGVAPNLLVYRRLSQLTGTPIWMDRHGREQPIPGLSNVSGEFPRLSPDARRLAMMVNGDVWVYDLSGRPPIRLTVGGNGFSPLWASDGRRIVYEGAGSLKSIATDGSEREPRPASPDGHFHPHGWSADGERLLAVELVGPLAGIVSLPVSGRGDVTAVLESPGRIGNLGTSLSPDGRWLAYVSELTGRQEVWVQPYPGPGSAVRVSTNSGTEPVWARNGRELFYLEGRRLMSVGIETSSGRLTAKRPEALFTGGFVRNNQPPSYDVMPDGRFVVVKPTGQVEPPITAIVNWTSALPVVR